MHLVTVNTAILINWFTVLWCYNLVTSCLLYRLQSSLYTCVGWCRGKKGESKTREKYKNWHLFFFLLLQPPKTDAGAPCPKNNWKRSCFAVYLQYHLIACDLISCSLFSFQSLYSRVPACQITTYYYVGFAYLMMKRYQVSMKKWKQTA